ncbi:transcription termination/antitermination NusG family protein [Aneurinibacillus thermoaerophilus]|uniref:transcription termination/antitermination NusG family protein n=1 Tax=Aneurinibacillus thermoaerophilus TaxID=143495 RepID=UPI002E1E9B0A|nr:transcription termination/antitermination NusG family protein [Aneurinibacillus thermoaerophilus]MED0677588.1 transcription termination/antitermination NusG family protein [Aneurinibacillus thermoaerophilus]
MSGWYAIQVRTGCEIRVADKIQKLTTYGILAVSTGLKKIVRLSEKGRQLAADVLYPGYIFVKVESLTDSIWHLIKSLPFVQRILDSRSILEEEMEIVLEETSCEVEVVVQCANTNNEVEPVICEESSLQADKEARVSSHTPQEKKFNLISFFSEAFFTFNKKDKVFVRIPTDVYQDSLAFSCNAIDERNPYQILKMVYRFCQYVIDSVKKRS